MTVQNLVSQIISYSHNEDTPDTNLTAKALTWLNSAYHELLQENLAFLKHKMLKQYSTTLVDEKFELPEDFYLLENIRLANGTSISKTEKIHYAMGLNECKVFDEYNQPITVTYIPDFKQLELTDSLNDLHISANFLQGLIWGALVWSSIYERGLHTQTELALFENKWTQAKQNYKVTLATYSDQLLRTKPYRYLN